MECLVIILPAYHQHVSSVIMSVQASWSCINQHRVQVWDLLTCLCAVILNSTFKNDLWLYIIKKKLIVSEDKIFTHTFFFILVFRYSFFCLFVCFVLFKNETQNKCLCWIILFEAKKIFTYKSYSVYFFLANIRFRITRMLTLETHTIPDYFFMQSKGKKLYTSYNEASLFIIMH